MDSESTFIHADIYIYYICWQGCTKSMLKPNLKLLNNE